MGTGKLKLVVAAWLARGRASSVALSMVRTVLIFPTRRFTQIHATILSLGRAQSHPTSRGSMFWFADFLRFL